EDERTSAMRPRGCSTKLPRTVRTLVVSQRPRSSIKHNGACWLHRAQARVPGLLEREGADRDAALESLKRSLRFESARSGDAGRDRGKGDRSIAPPELNEDSCRCREFVVDGLRVRVARDENRFVEHHGHVDLQVACTHGRYQGRLRNVYVAI